MMGRFTPEDHEVRALREKTGQGLQQCRRDLTIHNLSLVLSSLRGNKMTHTEQTIVDAIEVVLELV